VKVIDSSALIKYFSREEGWENVREVMLEGVVTLDLAIKELSNALWKKVRRAEMSIDIARSILEDLITNKAIPIESEDKYLDKAFEIAVEHGITVYDSLFIAMALKRSLDLITCDENQASIARKLGVKTLTI
jgi:predicted nucleic acid-binding protein